KNRAGHPDRSLNQDGLKNIRKQMPYDNSGRRRAKRTGSEGEFQFLHFENLRASQSRIARPTRNHERQNYFADPGSEKRRESDSQENSRKGKEGIDEKKIHDAIAPSTEVTGDGADGESGESASKDHADGNSEGDARPEEDSRKDVAAKFVRTHPVSDGRSFEAPRKILREGICRSDQRSQESNQEEQQRRGKSNAGEHALTEKISDVLCHEIRTRGSTTE